jgi:hypothetical protein
MLQTEAGRVATEVSSRLVDERETFNLLNRTQFGALSGGTTLQNANFGNWRSQSNSGRRMQIP